MGQVDNNNLLLVDTDILIDVGRGIDQAVTFPSESGERNQLAISAVTEMELIVGCASKEELSTLDNFLQHFQILEITPHISGQAKDLLRTYRLSHGLLIADALIAATGLSFFMPFVSKNQKDYRYIEKLQLIEYLPS